MALIKCPSELNDARSELASLVEISKEEICKCYNVDCKAERLIPDESYEPAYY